MSELLNWVGKTDLQLLDLIVQGHLDGVKSVLDAGCGSGRNLHYFARTGASVFGVDRNSEALTKCRTHVSEVAENSQVNNFCVAEVDDLPHKDNQFDLVISNAVLHFSRDEDHFRRCLDEMFRVLAPGGWFFARLCSDVGISDLLTKAKSSPEPRWKTLPDGSDRFVVDLNWLVKEGQRLGAMQHGRIKTVNVQNLRCMTTWILRKSEDPPR